MHSCGPAQLLIRPLQLGPSRVPMIIAQVAPKGTHRISPRPVNVDLASHPPHTHTTTISLSSISIYLCRCMLSLSLYIFSVTVNVATS